MTFKTILIGAMCAACAFIAGCQKPVFFPAASMPQAAQAVGSQQAFDVNFDGKADYYLFVDASGRINRVGYGRPADHSSVSQPLEMVDLDSIAFSQCRHIVIILDGFGYEVVKKFYEDGHLRVCYPPSRVIAPYPTLTDLAIEDALGYVRCPGFEALYFDAAKNALVGGSDAYMRGDNEPYNRLLQYRAGTIWDAIGYLYPWQVYGKEINDSMRVFNENKTREMLAYYVSSAGVSTADGAAGQVRCLEKVEQLVNQAVWQKHGKVKVTILSDHGHSYTPGKRIELEKYLTDKGWRLADKLEKPKDAVYVRFGLVTYVSFATRQPADLAGDLAKADGVELASYAQGDAVVVLGKDGKAVIRRKGERYKYEPSAGDPLKLKDILAGLTADGEGYYDENDIFVATGRHEYPDPLARLWRAHNGMAEHTPDVIVSLADNFYSGSQGFAGAVKVASTHGGLNLKNSSAFIMSSAGALPPLMRSADIPANMEKLTGEKFPMKK